MALLLTVLEGKITDGLGFNFLQEILNQFVAFFNYIVTYLPFEKKNRLNMSSLIANKVKINMCPHYLMCHCSNLYNNIYNYNCLFINLLCLQPFYKQQHLFIILLTQLFAGTNTCSLDLYSGDLQTMTILFTRNASSHKTD